MKMYLLIQLIWLCKSPNSGFLGISVGNFQFGLILTVKIPLYYSILDIFVLKIEHLAIFIILSTILILFLEKLIINVFYAILAISFLIGVKYYHAHHYCFICVPYPPLLIILKQCFLPEMSITFPVMHVTKA